MWRLHKYTPSHFFTLPPDALAGTRLVPPPLRFVAALLPLALAATALPTASGFAGEAFLAGDVGAAPFAGDATGSLSAAGWGLAGSAPLLYELAALPPPVPRRSGDGTRGNDGVRDCDGRLGGSGGSSSRPLASGKDCAERPEHCQCTDRPLPVALIGRLQDFPCDATKPREDEKGARRDLRGSESIRIPQARLGEAPPLALISPFHQNARWRTPLLVRRFTR